MPGWRNSDALILVLDTCGERASVALFRGPGLLQEIELGERTASAALLGALRSMLAAQHASVRDLAAMGIVNGPGSFTGLRVGLAMAKGLCEAASLPFAAVSRLSVLAEAAGVASGFALLPAGRGQVYVAEIERTKTIREWLTTLDALGSIVQGHEIAVVSPEVAQQIQDAGSVHLVELSARHAIDAVLRCLEQGGSDLAITDANYVRNEEAIYRTSASASEPSTEQAEK